MEAPPIWYLVAHPTALGLTVLRPALLSLAALAPLFLRWPHPTGRRAGALRVAAFACVVLALAGVRLTARVPDERLSLVVAVDTSDSVDGDGRRWQQRYLAELASTLGPDDDVAALSFAGDVDLVHPPDNRASIDTVAPAGQPTATDLGRAIDSAMALFPAGGQRRLLLLTDGNETRGDSRRHIPWLRAAGVRVDAAVPPHRREPDVRIEKLVVPPVVPEDDVISVRIVAQNTGGLRAGVLTLFLDGDIADSAAVELQPGRTTLEFPSQLRGLGSHRLRAELSVDGDPAPANNGRETGVTVRSKTRVLLVTRRAHSPLALALERKGLVPDVAAPGRAPRGLAQLLAYHGVVFEDLSAADLSAGAIENLERYVRDFGGGLVFAGGVATFGDPGWSRTAFQRLLPVTLEPHRPRQGAREPLALFLVVDRSNSMGYNSRIGTLRDGEKLRYAKEAALAVVRQLKDQDRVGVIAFDSQPREISPLRPLRENRALLEDLIPRLVENGGTDFYDALVSARDQLAASRVARRHVVLLTDGDTNRAAIEEYQSLIASIAAAQISVTTIRIGDNTVNLRLLQDISGRTGGEFHHVEDAHQLPDLMLRDTTRALSPLSGDGESYYPRLAARNQLLQGIDEPRLPPLAGYAYTRPKEGADILLRIARLERHDPLLAVWQYGLGRVAAFAASPADDAEQWLGWREFAKFWSQLVHWTAREHTEDEYAIDARRSGGVTELAIRTFGPAADGAVLVARLQLDDETAREVPLVSREPRRFTARLLDVPGGRYALTILRRNASGAVSQHTEMVTVPAADQDAQDEYERTEPNLALLSQLTEQTGGTLNPGARAVAANRPPGSKRVLYNLDHILLPLALLLLLADIAVRRLRLGASESHPVRVAPSAQEFLPLRERRGEGMRFRRSPPRSSARS